MLYIILRISSIAKFLAVYLDFENNLDTNKDIMILGNS